MPFGIAPMAAAFGAPASKSIVFGIDWIPYRMRELLVLVDVHLHELEVPLLGDPLEHGIDRVARPAPLGPEVDEHGLGGLEDLGLEGGVGYVGCHLFLSLLKAGYPADQY